MTDTWSICMLESAMTGLVDAVHAIHVHMYSYIHYTSYAIQAAAQESEQSWHARVLY
jgi:hypothetical protein